MLKNIASATASLYGRPFTQYLSTNGLVSQSQALLELKMAYHFNQWSFVVNANKANHSDSFFVAASPSLQSCVCWQRYVSGIL